MKRKIGQTFLHCIYDGFWSNGLTKETDGFHATVEKYSDGRWKVYVGDNRSGEHCMYGNEFLTFRGAIHAIKKWMRSPEYLRNLSEQVSLNIR